MQVLSSLSGLPISAVSAGFAPTNSADVSAIASAYQVVSSTATQLHAGTAYLTSVNGAPISASRAGQAANASLATSAYYDGTGRLISALPDSAAVSAIASSYAESAASGKQDTIEFGYDANNLISSIDGSALAGQGGGGGLITSIESALDPWYRTAISGLNGSSLYPTLAWSALSADHAEKAESARTANYAESAPTAWASSFITGVASPSGTIRVQAGTAIEVTNSAVLPSTVIEGFSIVRVNSDSTNTTSLTLPRANPTTRVHFGDAYGAPGTFAIDTDNGLHYESSIETYFDVWFDLPNATSFTATYPWVTNLKYTASASYAEEGGGVGELAWASALPTYEYDGDGKISAIDGSALAGGGGGGSVSSPYGTIIVTDGTAIEGTNSAIGIVPGEPEKFLNLAPSRTSVEYWYSVTLFGGQSVSGASLMRLKALDNTSNPEMVFTVSISGNPIGGGSEIVGTASATAYGSSMEFNFPLDPSWGFGTIWASANPSTIDLDTADINTLAFYSATTATGVKELAWKDELPTYQYDGDGKISAINGSAIGGMDEAAVSGIASAYAESAVSGKLDTTAFNSGDFYTTANESGFVDSAYVDSAVSGKMDSSASSSFYTTANESGFITGVDLTDYATTAYVDSSVSGKMDASAIDYTRTGGGTQIYASGNGSSTNQFSAKNDSAGAAIIAGENARLRLWDTAATANLYASSIGGWNAASNLVSSQSANWGGSALQLSAGPGVTLTKSGNLLVAGLDETVLWSGEGSAGNYALSEDPYNFETLRIYGSWQPPELSIHDVMIGKASAWNNKFMIAGFAGDSDLNDYMYARDTWFKVNNSGYNISAYKASETVFVGTNIDRQSSSPWAYRRIYKIVGINRTAEA